MDIVSSSWALLAGTLLLLGAAGCRSEVSGPGPQGDPLRPLLTVVGSGSWASVSTGTIHACALTTGGQAFCWGGNDFGQLGDGSETWSRIPVPVAGGHTFASISAGFLHSCAVTPTGAGYCWGLGEGGMLGNGSSLKSSVPVAVSGGLSFASISAGAGTNTCGVTTVGAGYCWGDWASDVPLLVAGGLSWTSISAGQQHHCGVTTGGAAYCWGVGTRGELGDGAGQDSSVPVQVSGGISFLSVTSGFYFYTCGVSTAGAGYCWGQQDFGDLGDGTGNSSLVPVPVAGGLTFGVVSAGNVHTCGVSSLGAGYCWGLNSNGQLGNGTTGVAAWTPVTVVGGLSFTSISAGGSEYTCGLTNGGSVYCWGRNSSGVLGNGSLADSNIPIEIAPPASPGETPPGDDVEVRPVDQTTGQPSPSTITFDNVTTGGETTVTSGTVGEAGGPPPPANFKLGSPPTYYDIATTATFTGPVTICISYAGTSYPNPSKLKLLHYEGGVWVDVTTSHDTVNQIICGTTTTLSPFLVGQTLYPFSGFFPPIQNQDAGGAYILNPVGAGSTVPVRFSLGGDAGPGILASGYPKSAIVPCNGTATADGGDAAVAVNGGLSYHQGSGQYIYNWKTDKNSMGCRQLIVKLDDGSEHRASFRFEK